MHLQRLHLKCTHKLIIKMKWKVSSVANVYTTGRVYEGTIKVKTSLLSTEALPKHICKALLLNVNRRQSTRDEWKRWSRSSLWSCLIPTWDGVSLFRPCRVITCLISSLFRIWHLPPSRLRGLYSQKWELRIAEEVSQHHFDQPVSFLNFPGSFPIRFPTMYRPGGGGLGTR